MCVVCVSVLHQLLQPLFSTSSHEHVCSWEWFELASRELIGMGKACFDSLKWFHSHFLPWGHITMFLCQNPLKSCSEKPVSSTKSTLQPLFTTSLCKHVVCGKYVNWLHLHVVMSASVNMKVLAPKSTFRLFYCFKYSSLFNHILYVCFYKSLPSFI